MPNSFYTKTGNPATNSAGSSSLMRAEFAAIEAGFDKQPTLTANGGKIVAVNAGATALEAVTTTGTGSAVRATSPTLVTPLLGTPTSGDATNLTNTIAPQTHAATDKVTPVDADELPLSDSAATFGLKKLTWANIKATLAAWINGGTIPGSFTTLEATGTAAGATTQVLSVSNLGGGANAKAQIGFYAASSRYAGMAGGYGASAPELSWDIQGVDKMVLSSTGLSVTGSVSTTGDIDTANAAYFKTKASGGSSVRMLGINGSNIAYVGPIDNATGVTTTIYGAASNTTVHDFYSGGTLRAEVNNTGLAVTGALSSTGNITNTAALNTDSAVVLSGSGTYNTRIDFSGAGGGTGQVRSTNSDMVYNVPTGKSHFVSVNYSNIGTFSSTGLAVTGALSATGIVKVQNPTQSILHISDAAGTGGFQIFRSIGGANDQNLNIYDYTLGTNVVQLASGNLGLGVPPSAWNTNYKALQVGAASLNNGANNRAELSWNFYRTGTPGDAYIISDYATRYTQNAGQHLWYTAPSGTAGNAITFTQALTLEAAGHLLPGTTDNVENLGSATYRWATVYAGTGTINTSDAREKTEVSALTPAEINAAKQLSKEIGTYKFLASIQAKGDAARSHIGMTVQRAIEIMESHGLEPFAYGFICHDVWQDEFTEHPAIEAVAAVEAVPAVEATFDEEGNELTPAVAAIPAVAAVEGKAAWTEQTKWAGDRYAFRYDQLNLFIAAGIEARLSALEAA